MNDHIPFHRPDVDAADVQAISKVLDSRWLTTGKEARAFEEDFARYVGADHALALSSCTAALHLALELANVRGWHVIVPTLTFTATPAAVLMAGGYPIIADVDPNSLTLSVETIRRAIDETHMPTVGVMPVHYGGNPTGFREIVQYAKNHSLVVIDDAAHALPAIVDHRRIGDPSLGAFATCYSFYPTKPITTAEGGMLVMGSKEKLEEAREMSNHGIDDDAYQRSRTGLYHYEVSRMGWKYNLPDLLATLGRSQLSKADTYWMQRSRIASEYASALQPLVNKGWLKTPFVGVGCVSAWHLYVVRFNSERFENAWSRDRVAEALKNAGVSTSMHYRPLHLHPFWRSMTKSLSYSNADLAYREILSLPIYPGLTTDQIYRVVAGIESVCRTAMR